MKIIDFSKKGNIVRFYLGADDLQEWYGDDWNDAPYEYNAGKVYDRFIVGHKDIAFPFDTFVLEPCEGHVNSRWCKNDMVTRRVPCIIAVPKEKTEDSWYGQDFEHWVWTDGVQRFFFGDRMELDAEDASEDA